MDYKDFPPLELFRHCLRTGEESAWVEFVRRFQPLIASVALRVARQWNETSSSMVDDLIQETYMKLCAGKLRLLDNFKSRHEDAIYGYVKVFTANLVHDHFKASSARKRGGLAEASSIDEWEAQSPVRMEQTDVLLEKKLLIGKVAACLELVATGQHGERDRRIFWLYYRVGLSASAIAALPAIGLSTKGVETTLLRLTRAIRHQLTGRKNEDARSSKLLEGISPENSL